ncbi:MAG: DUF4105 domain-containing protein [Prevotella sp.]|nr:DUF4105 domain-containing protein [Prevotella sp.]
MKHLKTVFRTILALLCACWTPQSAIAQEDANAEYYDSVEVSLLTCQPHDEVYSLYGHTAIRYHDMHKGSRVDAAFNYGVFDFKKPHFVLRFVFGLTDYELGAYPYRLFLKEYEHFGSMVTEQVLNLSNEEKGVLHQLLGENLRPENKVYRYNYFYNNCTTKARDIIEQCISGKVEYAGREDFTPSYRKMVHEMTRNNPWARFGNDLLLGIKADQQTDRRQQEFLPYNLMYDLDHAQIYENGQYRPMVKERRVAVPGGVQIIQEGFPLSPMVCGIILLLTGIIIFLAEWRWKRALLAWDLLLMLTTGVMGVTLFLMLFSQHPTVSLNLQFLLLNPLPWFFLWPVVKRRQTRYWTITAVLAVLFLVGALFQTYAEGIWSLALCLLLQCCIHTKRVSA